MHAIYQLDTLSASLGGKAGGKRPWDRLITWDFFKRCGDAVACVISKKTILVDPQEKNNQSWKYNPQEIAESKQRSKYLNGKRTKIAGNISRIIAEVTFIDTKTIIDLFCAKPA